MHLVRLGHRPRRSRRGFARAACLCLALGHAHFPQPAAAQFFGVSEDAILEKAARAFFHVAVDGTPRSTTDPLQEAQRSGKAFAVGSDMLVTALHVVGTEAEWQLARTSRDEITRAVRPLDRTITLTPADALQRPLTEVVVLPAPTNVIDAAGMMIPGLGLDTFFELSMCDIVRGKTYHALMTRANPPSDRDSINNLALVPLVAGGYETADYGPLYVFDPQGAPEFKSEPWGHDGSPVFDEDGTVVAVVSAVTVTANGTKILATPIQPLFPGTNQLLARAPVPNPLASQRLKCSMADTVRRIHDQVASHAIWTVTPEVIDGRATGNILFDYESVADPPNIASIKVEYQFWGPEKKGKETTRIAHRRGDQDIVTLEPGRQGRTFSTAEIVSVGRTLAEPYVRQGNGSIVYLRLTITPTLDTGETLDSRSKTYEVPWSAFQ